MHTVSTDMKKFSLPCTTVIAGQTRAGKSTYIQRLLLHHNVMFDQPVHFIYYCYSVWQKMYSKLEKTLGGDMIEFRTDLPSLDEIKQRSEGGTKHVIMILDDKNQLFDDRKSSKDLVHIVTVILHHSLCSTFLLSYTLFNGTQALRDINLNSQNLVLMANTRNNGQIKSIAHQIWPSNTAFFLSAYEQATKEKYGYLVVSLTADNPYKLKTNCFPGEDTVIFIPSNGTASATPSS